MSTTAIAKQSNPPSHQQKKELLAILKKNPQIVKGKLEGIYTNRKRHDEWNDIAESLNACRDGCVKDGRQWSKFWKDWRGRIRKRERLVKKSQPESEEFAPAPPLTEIELEVLQFIGPDLKNECWADWKHTVKAKAHKFEQELAATGISTGLLNEQETRLLKLAGWDPRVLADPKADPELKKQQQNLVLLVPTECFTSGQTTFQTVSAAAMPGDNVIHQPSLESTSTVPSGAGIPSTSDKPLIHKIEETEIKIEEEDNFSDDDGGSTISVGDVALRAANAASEFLLSDSIPSIEASTQTDPVTLPDDNRKRKHSEDYEEITMQKAIKCFVDVQQQKLEILKKQNENTARFAAAAERFAAAFEKIAEKL